MQTDSAYEQSVSHLRGGTPWQLYQWPYYVSVAHSTLYTNNTHHQYYTGHVIVLCVQPYRIVYVSDPMTVNSTLLDIYPLIRSHFIEHKYFYPTTLILENADDFVVGGHINDHSSVLLRFTGLRELMTQVMTSDAQQGVTHGPEAGVIQRHVHDVAENVTGLKFVHKPNAVNNY